ncbi:tRNA nucleotidyltransferase, A-adding [hydrothermal vent metagenome]|uniref:tRNA nucleotidyltransferase, A-adding n=1 Tax=hydrothermal vent metagenome TaxID=652676 RepID=A0A3B0WD66_9ZZZZ
MEIITTHLNADFDGLASMVAAKKLYPDAELVFAGSQEKSVRDFLAQEFSNIYTFKRLKQIDLQQVNRLIVVDTRQSSRIGRLQECLRNPGIEIHLFDHHPHSSSDIKGYREVVEEVGSTTTIFTRLFREQSISPTPDEATLMALGIYEDTGSFLHTTTTGKDLQATAWLLEHGAKLDIVTQFVSYDLSPRQVGLLGNLLKNATTYTIQSIEIVIAKLTLPEYVDNFAVILHRLMIMKNLDVLFGIICMGDRIHLIARSRIPEVNAGMIARDFGGGGHASAAAATIKNMTLFEAEEKLVHLLHQYVRPRAIAGQIMSSPVITVTPEVTIHEANNLLTRYNITVLPVVSIKAKDTGTGEPATVLGMISRRVVEKAIFLKLGHLPVSDYMTTEIATLPPTATLADLQELIIGNRQRLIPVVEHDRLQGVITRTDLLNILVNDPAHLPKNLLHEDEQPSTMQTRNMGNLLAERLNRDMMLLLQTIGSVAQELHYSAYVVGGFVRDLLLHIKNSDLDIVIEGDGIHFAKELARQQDATVRTHEKFGTATVIMPGGMRLDVATARLEYYEYPAAIPTVELSSIKLDLYRRDFTINAMAIHLNPEQFGTLVDFFNSQNDLKRQRINVLHNLSFVEDPTRILRAIRFEQRLEFQITKHTQKLIKNAVRMNLFDRFFAPRFFSELKMILSEDHPVPALRRMAGFDLFRFLWPDLRPNLKIDRRFIHILTQAEKAITWFKLLYLDESLEPWIVYLLGIMSRSRTVEVINFCKRFELSEKLEKTLVKQKTAADTIARDMLNRPHMKPSEIYWLLQDLSNEGLLYLMAMARKKHIQKAVSHFVTRLRGEQALINGQDLQQAGYQPGPLFRTMLNSVIEAQLNGRIGSRKEALQLIRDKYPRQAAGHHK